MVKLLNNESHGSPLTLAFTYPTLTSGNRAIKISVKSLRRQLKMPAPHPAAGKRRMLYLRKGSFWSSEQSRVE